MSDWPGIVITACVIGLGTCGIAMAQNWVDEMRAEQPKEPSEYKYLGDFSATPAWHSRSMSCDRCRVSWTGCWDNFQCPECGEGELPSSEEKNK